MSTTVAAWLALVLVSTVVTMLLWHIDGVRDDVRELELEVTRLAPAVEERVRVLELAVARLEVEVRQLQAELGVDGG